MILISFGGNIAFEGQSPTQVHAAAIASLADYGITVVRCSRFYKTPAWPDPAEPPFNNGVLAVETDLSPDALMDTLLMIEQRFGRQRSIKNAPRTLDLDVLSYHDVIMGTSHLTLPHPRVHERAFILKPLCDVAPDWQHPIMNKSAQSLLQGMDISEITLFHHPQHFLRSDCVMGVVNVTPDSFSDGGDYHDPDAAIAHGQALMAQGARWLDIGGESTRPGAKPVAQEEEQARILPVIEALSAQGAVVSVDTRHADTMRKALDCGAQIINDVTALTYDPDALPLMGASQCPVIMMHMQGLPETMQDNPDYTDPLLQVGDYLEQRVTTSLRAGVMPWHIAVDPGIGFGKTLDHNLILLRGLGVLRERLGLPVMLGASRKSFIEKICPGVSARERLPGSLASVLSAYRQGVEGFRVHDVAQTVQALSVFQAIEGYDR